MPASLLALFFALLAVATVVPVEDSSRAMRTHMLDAQSLARPFPPVSKVPTTQSTIATKSEQTGPPLYTATQTRAHEAGDYSSTLSLDSATEAVVTKVPTALATLKKRQNCPEPFTVIDPKGRVSVIKAKDCSKTGERWEEHHEWFPKISTLGS